MTELQLKEILLRSSIRDEKRFSFEVKDFQKNLKGEINFISGTVTDLNTKVVSDMIWNILGKSLTQDIGMDLVIKEEI